MSKKADQAALATLHSLLAQAFTGLIRDGVKVINKDGAEATLTAPAAYFKEAREFLKDNNFEALPEANKDLQTLADALPFPSNEDEEGGYTVQ